MNNKTTSAGDADHLANERGTTRSHETSAGISAEVGAELCRLRLIVHGAVQGVGFRPFVYRLASECNLHGWVNNTTSGVMIDVEGPSPELAQFRVRLMSDAPPAASVQSVEVSHLDIAGYGAFEILDSDVEGPKTTTILPDLATCPDCLAEMFDPHNRRYHYPFVNCTNCGPRYSIIEGLPYDRPNTTMRGFHQCPACQAEYTDPSNRRFHAQPNACPVCGPQVELWDSSGRVLAERDEALRGAIAAIARGQVVAIKGLGGFHLMADALNDTAVRLLRTRKHREEKPFAVMYPDLASVQADCEVSDEEARLLQSPQAPVVLLRRRSAATVAESVAPDNPELGIMLPYAPVHHLLMAALKFPVVATSGNLSDEPICISEGEAISRLRGVADLFLVNNRPIARHVDDSVVRIIHGREMMIRRARGYAPLPIPVREALPAILAVGAHQKCSVALSVGNQVVVSQHIGDLDTAAANGALARVSSDLMALYELQPECAAHDLHTDYSSTGLAKKTGLPTIAVQHHYAHALSCMAENDLSGPVLAVTWDGTGLGDDGTIWGGEFLTIKEDGGYRRSAHLMPFYLPGGEKAIREPRRTAISVLHTVFGTAGFHLTDLDTIRAFTESELAVMRTMLDRHLNAPETTSAGRLFDAVASLVGLRQRTAFEGQAAMLLEYAAHECRTTASYPVCITDHEGTDIIDWRHAIRHIVDETRRERPVAEIAARFHNTMVDIIGGIAMRTGIEKVVLTGGCFQNRYLLEYAVKRLQTDGFRVYWHQRIPPNDGGIALGQVMAAAQVLRPSDL